MSRDQRVQDNWAFIYSAVSFEFRFGILCLLLFSSKFLDATIRHLSFYVRALKRFLKSTESLNIHFHVLSWEAETVLPAFVKENNIGIIFVITTKNYDKVEGADDWAKKTLKDHSKDKREYIYTKDQFENAETHDLLLECSTASNGKRRQDAWVSSECIGQRKFWNGQIVLKKH
ncbi:DNA photolyase [Caerostris extrusa]|uniref:DNA photolyase n=1 Tax=Caerostris extrusa TaxID=172846 RepID=A0AAV4Y4V3_CAEEX|nr:DNA photolyase [Caerostris extrusa]